MGARPQFIKASALSRAIRNHYQDKIEEIIIHSGQHYDDEMSDVFFREMEIPLPKINLATGSGLHGRQTGIMLEKMEEIILDLKPNAVLVYGDTNTTLAAALAASKLHIPILHVEAGLRSRDKKIPEEINRLITDHLSTLLFCPTQTAIENLANEGFNSNANSPYTSNNPGVFHCGDVMYDNTLFFAEKIRRQEIFAINITGKNVSYFLGTIHRSVNTDNPERLTGILESLIQISLNYKIPVILPLHPRTKQVLQSMPKLMTEIELSGNIYIIPPVSFLQMFNLELHAEMIFTDSGGVQKEAYFLHKPCVIVNDETPWDELIESGNCIMGGTEPNTIIPAMEKLYHKKEFSYPEIFGDGHGAEFICKTIVNTFS